MKLAQLQSFKKFILHLAKQAVEINPFAEFAGGGLFDFIADRHVLDGKAPFEFRVRTELPDKRALAGIGEDWQRLMQRPSVSASLAVP